MFLKNFVLLSLREVETMVNNFLEKKVVNSFRRMLFFVLNPLIAFCLIWYCFLFSCVGMNSLLPELIAVMLFIPILCLMINLYILFLAKDRWLSSVVSFLVFRHKIFLCTFVVIYLLSLCVVICEYLLFSSVDFVARINVFIFGVCFLYYTMYHLSFLIYFLKKKVKLK